MSGSSDSSEEYNKTGRLKRATLHQRITSRLWKYDDFDPYQIFKVRHKKCHILRVQVYHGENIGRVWWMDYFLYKPSPYLVLHVKGSPDGWRKTPVVNNSFNPEWNVSFYMVFDPTGPNDIYITLMDRNYIIDTEIGSTTVHFGNLPLDIEEDYTVEFEDGSQVVMVFSVVKCNDLDLRFSLSLPTEEIEFVKKRRFKVFEGMKSFLGLEHAPKNISEVPIVSVIGSGGGMRAVVANTGVFKALDESGLLDCVIYVAGISGSTWYQTYLYTHPDFPEKSSPRDIISEIREKVSLSWRSILTLKNVYRNFKLILAKATQGLSINFIDVFGHVVGDRILGEQKYSKLSDIKRKLEDGTAPMPLFTCIVVKTEVSERVYQEFVEFSPYEVGLPKYGAFMKSENFGSKFYLGKIIRRLNEMPFHYLIGIWGSAFSILFRRLLALNQNNHRVVVLRDTICCDGLLRNRNLEEEDEDLQKDLSENEETVIRITESEKSIDLKNTEGLMEETLANHEHVPGSRTESESDSGHVSFAYEYEHGQSSKQGYPISTIMKVNKEKSKAFSDLEEQQEEETEDEMEDGNSGIEKPFVVTFQEQSPSNYIFSKPLNNGFPYDESGSSSEDFISHSLLPLHRRSTFSRDMRYAGVIPQKISKSVGFWYDLANKLLRNDYIKDTRYGRAGHFYNPLRGLDLAYTYPISPALESNDSESDFTGIGDPIDSDAKKLCFVDAGLAFNSPYPLLLRPQRAVDVFISFDYSSRLADFYDPFEELILAEQWAIKNNIVFPPVQVLVQKFYKEPMREIYVFKDPSDPYCPIIVHCIIFNGLFKILKAPNVKRETQEEMEFANFKIFSDPQNPYSSFNYTYTPLQFDRMSKLMEFNTLYGMHIFRKVLKFAVRRKRELLH